MNYEKIIFFDSKLFVFKSGRHLQMTWQFYVCSISFLNMYIYIWVSLAYRLQKPNSLCINN